MTRWAAGGTRRWRQALALLASAGAAAVASGCGGGGGGGNGGPPPAGACGSPAGSATPVICGRVVRDGTDGAVPGAKVTLRNAAGAVVGAEQTTDATGFFKFTSPPGTAVSLHIDPPAEYFDNVARTAAGVFSFGINNKANTGPCLPPIGAIVPGDKNLGDFRVFHQATPPPPPTACPV